MLVSTETGEVIAKGNKLNNRHSWSNNECIKCGCVKTHVKEHLYKYELNREITYNSPKCNNTKIEIHEEEPNTWGQLTINYQD